MEIHMLTQPKVPGPTLMTMALSNLGGSWRKNPWRFPSCASKALHFIAQIFREHISQGFVLPQQWQAGEGLLAAGQIAWGRWIGMDSHQLSMTC